MPSLNGFDARQVEPSTVFQPIPTGTYLAVIKDSEMRSNKAGTGTYLQLTFQIIEGEYRDRRLCAWLNLDHPNATAVQMAKADLSAICHAVQVMAPNDSRELHDLPLVIHVKYVTRTDGREPSSEIKGYSQADRQQVSSQYADGNDTSR